MSMWVISMLGENYHDYLLADYKGRIRAWPSLQDAKEYILTKYTEREIKLSGFSFKISEAVNEEQIDFTLLKPFILCKLIFNGKMAMGLKCNSRGYHTWRHNSNYENRKIGITPCG